MHQGGYAGGVGDVRSDTHTCVPGGSPQGPALSLPSAYPQPTLSLPSSGGAAASASAGGANVQQGDGVGGDEGDYAGGVGDVRSESRLGYNGDAPRERHPRLHAAAREHGVKANGAAARTPFSEDKPGSPEVDHPGPRGAVHVGLHYLPPQPQRTDTATLESARLSDGVLALMRETLSTARSEAGPEATLDWDAPVRLQITSIQQFRHVWRRDDGRWDVKTITKFLVSDGQHNAHATFEPELDAAWCAAEDEERRPLGDQGLLLQATNVFECRNIVLVPIHSVMAGHIRMGLRMQRPWARLVRQGPYYRHLQWQATLMWRQADAAWTITGAPTWLPPVPTLAWVVMPPGGREQLEQLAIDRDSDWVELPPGGHGHLAVLALQAKWDAQDAVMLPALDAAVHDAAEDTLREAIAAAAGDPPPWWRYVMEQNPPSAPPSPPAAVEVSVMARGGGDSESDSRSGWDQTSAREEVSEQPVWWAAASLAAARCCAPTAVAALWPLLPAWTSVSPKPRWRCTHDAPSPWPEATCPGCGDRCVACPNCGKTFCIDSGCPEYTGWEDEWRVGLAKGPAASPPPSPGQGGEEVDVEAECPVCEDIAGPYVLVDLQRAMVSCRDVCATCRLRPSSRPEVFVHRDEVLEWVMSVARTRRLLRECLRLREARRGF
jgi:hypothetical protein